jgi:hypothetical protein
MSASSDDGQQIRTLVLSVVGVILLLVTVWFYWPSKPLQMGADEDVFVTVDALFTAVTAHDEKLLSQTEQRLHGFKDKGKLPAGAATYLDAVIEDARGGDWQPAAKDLYWFMKGQRREGDRGVRVAAKHK